MPVTRASHFSLPAQIQRTTADCLFFIACVLLVFVSPASARSRHAQQVSSQAAHSDPSRVGIDRTGTVEGRPGLRLRLTADLGTVRILSAPPASRPQVTYKVRIETDARDRRAIELLDQYSLKVKNTPAGISINGETPQDVRGRKSQPAFWVTFEVTVPPDSSVDVETGAGDIETQDIGGTASLVTQAGNISAGRIGAITHVVGASNRIVARLETQGGHITVLDVAGDLHAQTAAGHIRAGNIIGDASLHTGGGHIRVDSIGGRADLDTGGGNITVREARGGVAVHTGGGQIEFGEAYGSVRAQTGGGGIRVVHVAGPIELETSDGSICLTRVAGTVRAATGAGSITAWINPDVAASGAKRLELSGASVLESGAGDIAVYLPRSLAATLEATAKSGGARRIQADPALQLKFIAAGSGTNVPTRAQAVLNGGGELLRIKTGSGTIHIRFLDEDASLRATMVREQTERINDRLEEVAHTHGGDNAWNPGDASTQTDWFDHMMDRLEEEFSGGIRVDPDEEQKRLVSSVEPEYPDVAKRAGVQGLVRLQIRVDQEGRVEVQKILEGEPVLADAAIAAAQRWKFKPMLVNGKPVSVITTANFNFKLR